MFPWHNADCDMEYRYTGRKGVRTFWCNTHNQWAEKFPNRVSYEHDPHWADKFLPEKETNAI